MKYGIKLGDSWIAGVNWLDNHSCGVNRSSNPAHALMHGTYEDANRVRRDLERGSGLLLDVVELPEFVK